MVTKVLVRKITKNPDYPSLDTSRLDGVASYLSSRNFLHPSERVVRVEPVGRHAHNATLRVATDERSLVIKRFRDWPGSIPGAPTAEDRFRAECQFHRAARIASCAEKSLPSLLHHDTRGPCIVFEDAGASTGMRETPNPSTADSLSWFLVGLHHHSQSVPTGARYDNPGVRQWLARRLFHRTDPAQFVDGWLDRLADHGSRVREALAEARLALAEVGSCLVHGDFLPSNWVVAAGRCRVVDAEFSFFGRPEIDAGSLLAGLLFRRADEPTMAAALGVLESGCVRYDPRHVAAFTGAHLCALLDGARGLREGSRRSWAIGLVRRTAAAIESGSLAELSGVPAGC